MPAEGLSMLALTRSRLLAILSMKNLRRRNVFAYFCFVFCFVLFLLTLFTRRIQGFHICY